MELTDKLAILADAAKYDASCASSGSRPGRWQGALGTATPAGVCHSFTPDGRCISLFKVLLTNQCRHHCAYCPSRAGADGPRAAFTVAEVVELTTAFYRRNYVEGLFLSSGVPGCPDAAMEKLVRVVKDLRLKARFGAYIHLKVIPGADPGLVAQAGRYVDRLSANLELPTPDGLRRLAPGKDFGAIQGQMARLRDAMAEHRHFAPGGQSTQLVVGADDASDATILSTANGLYGTHRLKRVYYSAYCPTPGSSLSPAPHRQRLTREHRLYQADWLLRFYGFGLEEIVTDAAGMLDPDLDPKTAWALRHRGRFPVDVNRAPRQELLRVPGLGTKSVERILVARRQGALRLADLARLRAPLSRVRPFVVLADHHPGRELDAAALPVRFRQLSLFGTGH